MKTTRTRRNPRGFTLIELLIVIVITGILAALAVTTYNRFADKARMTQAQTTLMHLQKTQTIYFTEHEQYSDNLALLDFDPTKYNYYMISVVLDNTRLNFTGIATGVDAMQGDRWTIRREGDPLQDNTSTFR
jgi:type IV pilus assembly protein PilE